jgi:hypothetical protein
LARCVQRLFAAHRIDQRLLHVTHRLRRLRIGEALRHRLRVDVFDVLVNPPEIVPRIAHAADAIAEREMRRSRHQRRAGGECARNGFIDVLGVQAKERRRLGPVVLRVECHHARVADRDFDV